VNCVYEYDGQIWQTWSRRGSTRSAPQSAAEREVREVQKERGRRKRNLVFADHVEFGGGVCLAGDGGVTADLGFPGVFVGSVFEKSLENEAITSGGHLVFEVNSGIGVLGELFHVGIAVGNEAGTPIAFAQIGGELAVATTQDTITGTIFGVLLEIVVEQAECGFDLAEVAFSGRISSAEAGIIEIGQN